MDSNVIFHLIPFALSFIGLIFVIVIGLMFYIKVANDRKPILTVDARIVSKDIEADETHFNTSTQGPDIRQVSFEHRFYHITFQSGDESPRRFFVSKAEYQRLSEGDLGSLTFQGGRYLGFKKS